MSEEAKHTPTAAELVAEIEAGLEGVTPGPWAAWMDDYTVRKDATFIPEQRKVALCATCDGAGKNAAHIARCSPDNMRVILTELSTLRTKLERAEKALAEVRAFAESFHFTVVKDSHYQDAYMHISEPDKASFRLGNGSQFSKFIASLERRRSAALSSIRGEDQQPDNEGWIDWKGGECPVDAKATVDIKFRDGTVAESEPAGYRSWEWSNEFVADADEIVAYRVVKP